MLVRFLGVLRQIIGRPQVINKHLEHCIDSLRQLITCHSDVSTHYWRWNPKQDPPQTQNHPQVLHTCRDFEAIQEWAQDHLLSKFDRFTRVENPLAKE
jgi:hypothetical protein